jgi:hypothetical protein
MADLSTFKPTNLHDFLAVLVESAKDAALGIWSKISKQVKEQLSLIGKIALDTIANLLKGRITDKQANHTLQLLEINFSAAIMLFSIVPFAVAEAVRGAVFNVINAVVRNFTGIDFGFGD